MRKFKDELKKENPDKTEDIEEVAKILKSPGVRAIANLAFRMKFYWSFW